ncbi:hypothetical protein EZ313_12910 [Ramlibacter henchirensis]|uniref:Uncharacterized protein n=1 Tax=Ramlibacter henchirensis TaxID=204072 RepID=A0A4Z0BVV1_9BURK|nr:hypothetical protein [Ramlibacter henchirensis]TFZ02175.1 hypothetical protein EZ313_12910 [Ramlibacter henchirensis]
MKDMFESTLYPDSEAAHVRSSKQVRDVRAAAPWLALAVALASLAAWLVFPAELVIDWTHEGSLIEDLTIALYLVAAVGILAVWRSLPKGVAAALALTMLAFAAREADWHIHFTGTSMLRVSYYLGPAPLTHKLLSFAAVGALLAGWLYLTIRAVRAWRSKRLHAGAVGANTLTFLGVLVFAKLLDRLLSVLAEDFGVATNDAMRALQVAIEEPLEMVLPVIVLATVWQYLAWQHAD